MKISKQKRFLSAIAFSLIAALFLSPVLNIAPGVLAPCIFIVGVGLAYIMPPVLESGSLAITGFLPYILMQSKDVFQNATPSKKITPPGFLKMLLNNDMPDVISKSTDDGSGHFRNIKIKYRQRVAAGQSVTTDDCAINAIPVYSEASIPATLFRKYAIHLDDATIANYEKEASAVIKSGNPVSDFPQDLWDALIEAANGLFADINGDLLAAQASAFGVNQTTGSNASKTINFSLATTVNNLGSGMAGLNNDLMLNEMHLGDVQFVGSGVINQYYLNAQAVKGNNQAGIDTNDLGLPKLWFDPYATTAFGANKFGVFEKNAVQLLNINRFDGFRAGDKLTTILGTMTLPVVDFMGDGQLQKFKFDYQLKYVDCPTTINTGYSTLNVNRGWVLTLMSSYNLFNVPSDSYASTDRLYQNNGTLLYAATNS